MKLIKLIYSIIFLFPFCVEAYANGFIDEKIWVGTSLGTGSTNFHDERDNFSLSGKFDFGYDINRNFGAYTSYDFIQGYDHNTLHLATIGVRGNYPISSDLKVVGKFGATSAFGYNKSSAFFSSYGTSLEYEISSSISARIGFDFYDIPSYLEHPMDTYQFTWGLSYYFGKQEKQIYTPTEIIKEVPIEVTKIEEKKQFYVISGVMFKVGSIKPDSILLLDDVVLTLKEYEYLNVHIIGHTDSTGSETINKQISKERARYIYDNLIKQGISHNRITFEGKGSSEPVAINNNEEGRYKNRRVELYIN
ncbi:OmpA family protein [Vibrio sp. E150_018]